MGTDGNLRHLRKFKPDFLIGVPTFVYHLLHQAAEEGVHCENLRRIVLGGEKVSDGLRQKLRDLARELGAREVDVARHLRFHRSQARVGRMSLPARSTFRRLSSLSGSRHHRDHRSRDRRACSRPDSRAKSFSRRSMRVAPSCCAIAPAISPTAASTYEPCPHCGRSLPRLVGNISRRSEVRQMSFDKIKGTLVDFNELEHVLDDAPHIGAWQIELRKVNDDPLELDEFILHVQKLNGADEAQLSRELNDRCVSHLEIHPNRIRIPRHRRNPGTPRRGPVAQRTETRGPSSFSRAGGRATTNGALRS